MGVSRRDLIKRGAGAAAVASLPGGAGCTGARPAGGSSGDGSGGGQLRLAYSAPAETTDINTWYGPREVAVDDYGLETSIKTFEGVALAVQSVLAGEADVARGSTTAAATVVDAGKPFRFVFSIQRSTDYVLVTRPGIESLEDIVAEDAVIGMSAPTGLDAVQTAAAMFERDVIDSVDELNFQRVGYSSARQSAMLEGSIDVSPQHYSQWLQMRERNGDLNRLVTFGELLDGWIQETYMAPERQIENNYDTIVDLLAAQLRAHRNLYDDFELYERIVRKFVPGGGPSEENLRKTYEFLTRIGIWPRNGDLSRGNVDYMLDIADRLDLTDDRIPTDDVLDRRPLEDALEEVGRV